MANHKWIKFNDIEVVNTARTARLAEVMDLDMVWDTPESSQWIADALASPGYGDVRQAPWYDSGLDASGEFAGIISLDWAGLDDSTLTSQPIEYITDGGHSGKPRNATLSIVANVALVARSERGAEYGKRWLEKTLRGAGPRIFCSGSDLHYFRYGAADSPMVHRRNVRVTRGVSVTRKKRSDCAVTWIVQFTLTAADPFEYGEPAPLIDAMSAAATEGPAVLTSGSLAMIQSICPTYDYTPITDPQHPSLVPSPTAPDFYPDGWELTPGATFQRFWTRTEPVEPTTLDVVPLITLNTGEEEARMVRVSVWPSTVAESEQCEPLFDVILTYIPANTELTVDGEKKAIYVWDGVSPGVRRADGLAFSGDANPIQWTSFNDPDGYLVALDLLDDGSSDGLSGAQTAVAVSLIPKSD